MITLGSVNLKIEEKINIKIMKRLFAYVQGRDSNAYNMYFILRKNIKRFSAEDLYSIYDYYDGNLFIRAWKHEDLAHSIINIINNKIKLQKPFLLGQKDYDLSHGKLIFHHSETQEKFRNTKYLFSYLKVSPEYWRWKNLRFYKADESGKKLLSHAFFLEFEKILTTYKINSQSLVKLKFIKNIKIKDSTRHWIIKQGETYNDHRILIQELEKKAEIKPNISYSNFFIKFHSLNPLKHNFELATIYWQPDDPSDVFISDFKFNNKSYIKIGNKKYKLVFKKSINLSIDKKRMKKGQIIEVGKLTLPEFTSYDFDKGKITDTVDEFSEHGILIPYNFKGNFFYQMHISINEVFKDLDFFVHQKVDKKILDLFEGKIKIEITDDAFEFNNKNINKLFFISSDFFKEILEMGEFINPLAIVRFSDEEEEE